MKLDEHLSGPFCSQVHGAYNIRTILATIEGIGVGHISLHALTAGTHGNIAELERMLGFPLHIISSGEEKMHFVEQLGPAVVIAFGNGRNDVGMLRLAAIGVAILAGEGVAIDALQAADVLVPGPVEAIDLVLKPKRLIATLRG